MKIYFKQQCGAGDTVNTLPILNYFVENGDTVYSDTRLESAFKNSKVLQYNNEPVDHVFTINFETGKNIPATALLEQIKNKLFLDLSQQTLPQGIIFDDEEKETIKYFKSLNFVNILTYTSIKQKRINGSIVFPMVSEVKNLGYKIKTSIPLFDSSCNEYEWEAIFSPKEIWPEMKYFSREWIITIAGATFNICCDGGAFNVSLSTHTPTIGLLTIADESLAALYPKKLWEVVNSDIVCSPCFKNANYDTKEVNKCISPINHCGNNFSLEKINNAIQKLITNV